MKAMAAPSTSWLRTSMVTVCGARLPLMLRVRVSCVRVSSSSVLAPPPMFRPADSARVPNVAAMA